MAVQAMTIANRGVRYKPYIVDSIHTYNMEKTIKETQPEVVSKIDIKYSKLYDYIEQGMILASQSLAGEYSLSDLPYKVAIKTGTPQRTAEKTDSAFIGYYPVGNPEIAFAGIVEEGEYSKYMVRKIIDAYYGYDEIKAAQTSETAAQNQTPSQASETTAQTTPANAQTSQSQPAAETTFVQDAQRNEDD
jgi:penicillin-binding protein 2